MSHEVDVRGYEEALHVEKSLIENVQVYYDESRTTMKLSGLTFYLLHINAMNFIESMQDMMCSSCHTMPEFWPIKFMDNINGTYLENNMLPPLNRLNNVHHVIAQVVQLLVEKAVREMESKTKEQNYVRLHFVFGQYADVTERKDMHGVINYNRTMQPCSRCHNVVQQLKNEHHKINKTAETLCYSRSAVARFMGEQTKTIDDTYLDIYALFSVQPMHVFHLGVSRILKEVATKDLGSITHTADEPKAVEWTSRTFDFIC